MNDGLFRIMGKGIPQRKSPSAEKIEHIHFVINSKNVGIFSTHGSRGKGTKKDVL